MIPREALLHQTQLSILACTCERATILLRVGGDCGSAHQRSLACGHCIWDGFHMHVTATVDVKGTDQQAMTTVLQTMVRLGWDIEAQAGLWVRAESGEWWEKKVDVEAVVGGGSVTIDAEGDSVLPVGPAWRMMIQRAVDELVAALGGTTPAPPAAERVQAVKAPVEQKRLDPNEWRDLSDSADSSAPEPARVDTLPLAKASPAAANAAGAAAAAAAVGRFAWWVVKEVGGALVAITVGKAVDGRDDGAETKKGKLEYDLSSNTMLIRWVDGSATVAPRRVPAARCLGPPRLRRGHVY